MAKSCEFKTAEASTKAWLRTNEMIDNYLNIREGMLGAFREQNTKWSKKAFQKYNGAGIKPYDRLFYETDNGRKVIPNTEMFQRIDAAKGVFYKENLKYANDIKTTSNLSTNIKPGVAELFESNESFANAVYEAAEFTGANINIPNYVVVTRPYSDENIGSKGRTGNMVEFTSTEEDLYRQNMGGYLIQTNDEGRLYITDIEKFNEDSTFNGLGTVAYVDFYENYKHKSQGLTTDKSLTSDGIKVLERLEKIGLVYKTDAVLVDDTQKHRILGTTLYKYNKPLYEFNFNWSRNQITSQQKQQAQQLYSSYLQTTNNPTIEGFKQWNNRQQQINELFESNPELANAVYEAAGFKITNKEFIPNFNYYKNVLPIILKTKEKEILKLLHNKGRYLNDIDLKFIKVSERDYLEKGWFDLKKTINAANSISIGFRLTDKNGRTSGLGLRLLQDGSIAENDLVFGKINLLPNIDIKEVDESNSHKTIEYFINGVEIGKANLIKSEEDDSDIDYIEDWNIKSEYQSANLGYVVRKAIQDKYPTIKLSSSATDKSKYLYEKAIANQITPQQKATAQQLYSQYLDTIFPDSKVKDIVYHATFKNFLNNTSKEFSSEFVDDLYNLNLTPDVIKYLYSENGSRHNLNDYGFLLNRLVNTLRSQGRTNKEVLDDIKCL